MCLPLPRRDSRRAPEDLAGYRAVRRLQPLRQWRVPDVPVLFNQAKKGNMKRNYIVSRQLPRQEEVRAAAFSKQE